MCERQSCFCKVVFGTTSFYLCRFDWYCWYYPRSTMKLIVDELNDTSLWNNYTLASSDNGIQPLDVLRLVSVGRPRAVADVPQHALLVHDPRARWGNHHSPVVVMWIFWHFSSWIQDTLVTVTLWCHCIEYVLYFLFSSSKGQKVAAFPCKPPRQSRRCRKLHRRLRSPIRTETARSWACAPSAPPGPPWPPPGLRRRGTWGTWRGVRRAASSARPRFAGPEICWHLCINSVEGCSFLKEDLIKKSTKNLQNQWKVNSPSILCQQKVTLSSTSTKY